MDEEVVDRRQWLRGLFVKTATTVVDTVAEEANRRLPPRRRPPGAVEESLFLARCTRCRDCVEACPHRAIFTIAPEELVGADTPLMRPDVRACHMCTDFPCVAACGEQALLMPDGPLPVLGRVTIDPSRCITFLGPECGACGGLCPAGAPALSFERTRPTIQGALCVGCGLCIEACITDPKAILLEPLAASKEGRP